MVGHSKTPTRVSARGAGEGSDSKDQLVCRLELQQTINAQKIWELQHIQQQMAGFRDAFAFLYEHSPVGLMMFDQNGRIYDLNQTAMQLLGDDHGRLKHLPVAFLTYPADHHKILNHLERCKTESRVVTRLRIRNKKGNVLSVQLMTMPVNVVNRRRMFLTAIVDMTEQSVHEHLLAETKDFAEAIVETVRHPLAVLDSELRIVSVNRAFTDLFRRPAQFVRGRVFEVMLNLWWSGNELRSVLERVLIKNVLLENHRLDVELPEVGRRILLVSARRLRQKEKLPHRLLVLLEDASELQLAKEALSKTNEELEKRVAARTEALRRSYEQMESFCYSIAHDLRAPLRSMTGFSHLLQEQFTDQMTEQGKDYASRIRESAGRMDQLIRDLLGYGRLSTAALETTPVDLEKIFDEVLLQQEQDIRDKCARVRKAGHLPVVVGHHAVCQTILGNLVSNALKFVPPTRQPRIVISSENIGDWARIWVADNGIGIAHQDRDKIFGVFQRLHSTASYPGTGIGLAIVARGIDRMGGRMGLESEPGKGSRFWIELPRPNARR